MYKMQLTKDYTCSLNLLSIQQGEKESRASCEKYFKAIINDTMRALKNHEKSYLFNQEQIQVLKEKCRKERIKFVIREIDRGIWLVVRK